MTVDEHSLRVRMAAREIFGACFPEDDYEHAEREDFPRYQSAMAAARSVLSIKLTDLPERLYLTAADVAFEIRYALGQAPASIYVDARSKEPVKRERALERLVDLVSARFASAEVSRHLKTGWRGSPFGRVSGAKSPRG